MNFKTLRLLTASVFLGLLLPVLVQEGMFLDGVSYACIARNMAEGLGSFTQPFYTSMLYPVCYEQPPLALWLQSLFFRIFGDHFWVERLYTFCMAVCSAWGVVLLWHLLATQTADNQAKTRSFSWLPVLIWILAPVVFWGYSNNMLECTMSVFVLAAAYFGAKWVWEKQSISMVLAVLATAAAVLCKGPVGFFPVAVPAILSLVFQPKHWLRGIGQSALMLTATLAALALFIHFVPGMSEYLDYYLHKQLLPTLSGAREKHVTNPFAFLLDLGAQIAIPAIGLLIWGLKRTFKGISLPKPALFSFAIGLTGTLPLVLTPKQSLHYLLPALPFFALGFGSIFVAGLSALKQVGTKWAWTEKLAWVLLVATLLLPIFFWGKTRRDAIKIQDVKAICAATGSGQILSIPGHLSSDWLLIAYFNRFGKLSLDEHQTREYWLGDKGQIGPEGFVKMNLELHNFGLWRKPKRQDQTTEQHHE